MSDDPLTAFISRSLRAEVTDVRSELVTKNPTMEIERVRFLQEGEPRSLVVKRVPPAEALEVQLLPFLARRVARSVPSVRSRGIPPAKVPAWPWVLIEDLLDAASACHGEALAIVRAKESIERAVAQDEPALRALGVPTFTPRQIVERVAERSLIDRPLDAEARAAAAQLATLPVVLCHGTLSCANARSTDRGVVLVEWRRAHLGCGLLDIARLEADVRAFSGQEQGDDLFREYGELTRMTPSRESIRAARLVDKATRAMPPD